MAASFVNNMLKYICESVESKREINNLSQAKLNKEYTIKKIETNQEDLEEFLFTLGCYEGEKITVISVLSENYVVVLKDARYSIDKELAEAVKI